MIAAAYHVALPTAVPFAVPFRSSPLPRVPTSRLCAPLNDAIRVRVCQWQGPPSDTNPPRTAGGPVVDDRPGLGP